MLGKPVIKGTCITVALILGKLSQGDTTANVLKMYPHLQEEDVLAALTYASDVLANEKIIELPS
jgi:uncharacterized protein (DUF433 family)